MTRSLEDKKTNCKPEGTAPTATPLPEDSTLGQYRANGHLTFDSDAAGNQTPRLVVYEHELRPIWEREAEPRGVSFKQFMGEIESVGTGHSKEAYPIYADTLERLAQLPGHVSFRYLRICVCWRRICICIWIKI